MALLLEHKLEFQALVNMNDLSIVKTWNSHESGAVEVPGHGVKAALLVGQQWGPYRVMKCEYVRDEESGPRRFQYRAETRHLHLKKENKLRVVEIYKWRSLQEFKEYIDNRLAIKFEGKILTAKQQELSVLTDRSSIIKFYNKEVATK